MLLVGILKVISFAVNNRLQWIDAVGYLTAYSKPIGISCHINFNNCQKCKKSRVHDAAKILPLFSSTKLVSR